MELCIFDEAMTVFALHVTQTEKTELFSHFIIYISLADSKKNRWRLISNRTKANEMVKLMY